MVDLETFFVKAGSVSGKPVKWYRVPGTVEPKHLAYRTMTIVDEQDQRYLVATVFAESASQMNERLDALQNSRYRALERSPSP
jgi:hypothetical protein